MTARDNAHILSACQRELVIERVRASGPGGQNVNKVATAIQLRFDVRASDALPLEVKRRLRHLAGRRITPAGMLIIQADRYRTQGRNQADALERFNKLLTKSMAVPKPRRATKPSAASKERRLQVKKRHAEIKRTRRQPGDD